jgi:hypothetical protein
MKQLFEQEAPELARHFGLRERSIPLASLLYLLMLGWWKDPQASPSHLSRFATTLGMQVCKQDLDHHFTQQTANWLLAVLQRAVQRLVCSRDVDLPLLRQFTAVLIEDGSSISLPSALKTVWGGCGGSPVTRDHDPKNEAALKITVRWDLLRGLLEGPYLQEGRSSDLHSVLREQVIAQGSLWIADLGYWSLQWLHHLSVRGVYFLMRMKSDVCLWYQGRQVDVLTLLPQQIGDRVELPVELGAHKQVQGVRMLAERVPQHVVEQRHKRLYEYAHQHSKPVSQRALELAGKCPTK